MQKYPKSQRISQVGTSRGEAPIDPKIMADFRNLEVEEGDPFLDEVIELFLKELGANLHSIRDAILAGDRERAARVAHSINGSARNFGARTLSAICTSIEQSAAGESGESLETLQAQLEAESVRVRRALLHEKKLRG